MNINKISEIIEEAAPLDTQEEWDNSGWQIKLTDGDIKKVMVALEVNRQVIYDAVLNNADVIVTHHPLIFKEVKTIDEFVNAIKER